VSSVIIGDVELDVVMTTICVILGSASVVTRSF
jgi:hypothetical protein